MAWETRKGRQYYYRSKLAGNTVRKVYLVARNVAEQAAENDAAAKAKWAAGQAELVELQAKLASVDQLTAEAQRGVDLLTERCLLALGFHEHHGQWRKARTQTGTPS